MRRVSSKAILFGLLAAMGVAFVVLWWRTERRRASGAAARPTPKEIAVGAVTDFLDALGIGSFAPTTSFYKFGKMVPDEQIPGTMNVGHTLPTLAEAFIFITVIQVDMTTLSAMVAASVVGA